MLGSRGSFDPFVSLARPHPGQIESAHLIWSLLSESKFAQGDEEEVKIEDDEGVLRQDRYSLRTSPQWLGPQFEDIKRVEETIRIEVNSTTDNPLVEPPREPGGQGTCSSNPDANLTHVSQAKFITPETSRHWPSPTPWTTFDSRLRISVDSCLYNSPR